MTEIQGEERWNRGARRRFDHEVRFSSLDGLSEAMDVVSVQEENDEVCEACEASWASEC